MMGKVSNNELATVLVDRKRLSKKNASKFVNDMFSVIRQGLQNERMVKVKGLGTFKIIDVDDRESVNVNTGERVLIEGHSKISFSPDAMMKELVNKPFSQFETVVLNDGVDFEDSPHVEEIEEPEPMIESEPVVEKEQVVEPEPVIEPEPVMEPESPTEPEPITEVQPEPVSAEEDEIEPSVAPLVDFVTPEEVSEETTEKLSEETMDEADGASYNAAEEEPGSQWKKWTLIAALCCVCFVAGYFVGQYFATEPAVSPVAQSEAKADSKPVAGPVTQPKTQPEVKTEAKQDSESKTLSEPQPETKAVSQPEPEVALDKYEQMDSRVRTGAYRIVGTDHVEKVKSTDNLSRICKRTIGPGMECYLEVYNGIKGDADLKVGQEIKIPKLEHKKKKIKK